MGKFGCWIEAMRLRTLPVSVAGVVAGAALGIAAGKFMAAPVALCLAFAVVAQVASNFANEYYDFKDGLDRKGREGPRRGVTEGDITPDAMKRATFVAIGLAGAIGCSLIWWGGWWLIGVGVLILLAALGYSAGPYPLSRHGLGEVAVVVFFGLVPVGLTFYLQSGEFTTDSAIGGLAVGLLSANILIVNNYRDEADDRSVGKLTTAVRFGRSRVLLWYLFGGYAAVGMMLHLWLAAGYWPLVFPAVYLALHTVLWRYIRCHDGATLNRALGMTAMLELFYAVSYLVSSCFTV